MKTIFQIAMVAFILSSCKTNQTRIKSRVEFPNSFEMGLKAQGGLEKWKSYGTLHFSEITETDTTKYTVDLKNRNELIEKEGHYKVGFTDEEINIYPNKDSFPNENPRFMHNLRFYFLAIQFVTADPGAIQTALPPAELNGKMYNRVKITFGDGVGVAPKDQYILWYDQSDNMLSLINYSVTYFDKANAEKYNAIGYRNWVGVGGLKFPTEMIGYKWENDALGEIRYRRKFGDISISKDRPNPSIFSHF